MNSHQALKLNNILGSVLRQEVNFSPMANSTVQSRCQLFHWVRAGNSDTLPKLVYGWLGSHPNYIVQIVIGSVEAILPILNIDYANQVRQIEPKEVQKTAILAETIGVARVVHGRLGVARNKD